MNQTVRLPRQIEQLDEVGKFIGNTPLYPIKNAYQKDGVEIYAKLEWRQLGQSVKARPAYEIIREAILAEELHPGKRLLDATSGNTGIAYASITAQLGIPLTICLPENASAERKQILTALGAELIFTSPLEGTDGSQREAKRLAEERPDLYFYADQYNNPNNWKAHYRNTAREVYHQTYGRITHFVTGLGTTGSFVGTGKKLREVNPEIKLISLHPETSMHGLEGWKDMETAKVPGIYEPQIADQQIRVSTEEAYHWVKEIGKKEGMLVSPSSAANLAGAIKVAEQIDSGVIVTLFTDDASKYGDVLQHIFS
ncbi:MAG: cysteine synthase family protein [Bacteroidota bacterium]